MELTVNIDAVRPPTPLRGWALFLDIDGTLLDIAATPESVVVPAGLVPSLERAAGYFGGALALVSGRPLAAIDQLMAPLELPCAAEHSAVIRSADGTISTPGRACRLSEAWITQLQNATVRWKGVIVDPKAYSVAVHYRLAPERQSDVRSLLQSFAAEDPEFEVMPARMAYELRHKRLHKGAAVRHFMQVPPFEGRAPVFVGDDVTDEDGFAAARELGGLALHVDRVFGGEPANVRAWLNKLGE